MEPKNLTTGTTGAGQAGTGQSLSPQTGVNTSTNQQGKKGITQQDASSLAGAGTQTNQNTGYNKSSTD